MTDGEDGVARRVRGSHGSVVDRGRIETMGVGCGREGVYGVYMWI